MQYKHCTVFCFETTINTEKQRYAYLPPIYVSLSPVKYKVLRSKDSVLIIPISSTVSNRVDIQQMLFFFFFSFLNLGSNLAILGKAGILSIITSDTPLRWSYHSHVIHKNFSDLPSPKITPFSKVLNTVLSNHIFDMNILSWTIYYPFILNPDLDTLYSFN